MANIIKIEMYSSKIEIEYDDESKEEIEGGIYEAKDSDGDTTVERTATEADFNRLYDLARAFEVDLGPITSPVIEVERYGSKVEIKYADGSSEEIEGAFYERKDASDEDVIERMVTQEDLDRINDRIDSFVANGGTIQTSDDSDDDDRHHDGDDDDDDYRGRGSDDDHVRGRGGDDDIDGGRGEDDIHGGRGHDTLKGGLGFDTVSGGSGRDNIRGGKGDDECDGGSGNDRVRGNQHDDSVSGGDGRDRVWGGTGDDIVNGDAGDDRVRGGAGRDVISGGEGRDHYWGNGGADTFVIEADGARDKIHDFQDGLDVIDISAFGLADIDAVLALASQDGDEVEIDFGGGDVLEIDDTRLADLTTDDFIF